MMRRLFLAVALFMTWSIASANTPLKPTGHVNDFANIIPPSAEISLEKKLRDYNKITSVEMVVVTTPSLNGEAIEPWSIELAVQWGIGKKGADNGLLLVVAPNERTYRVEVGYGLEGIIPDAVATRYAREILPGAFRVNDYAGGINNLMSQFMEKIGTMSAEERAEMQAERVKAEELRAEQARQQTMEFFAYAGGLLAFSAFVFILVRAFTEQRRKKALREEILAGVKSLEPEISEIVAVSRDFNRSGLPKWMLSKVIERIERINLELPRLEKAKEEIRTLVRFDPDEAKKQFAIFSRAVKSLIEDKTELEATHKNVENFRASAAQAVHDAVENIPVLETTVRDMTNEGYRINSIATEAVMKKISRARDQVLANLESRGEGENDRSDSVFDEARKLQVLIGSVQQTLDMIRDNKRYLDRELPLLELKTQGVTAEYSGKISSVIVEICESAPEHVWKKIREQYAGIPMALEEIDLLLKNAKENGSMLSQRFDEARQYAGNAQKLLEKISAIHVSILRLFRELEEAKRDTPSKREKAKRAILNAQSSVQNSNAGSDSQGKLAAAVAKMRKVETILSSEPIDWLEVVVLADAACKLAESAKKMADDNIEEAERAARRRRNAESSSSGSYTTGTSSRSSSNSGGFGGFGGGGFGGGGASGKW